jgi:N-acetylglucosaminyldiphosphoundecaprenol N-acetyl-beta-D-mannosaminyltransferase
MKTTKILGVKITSEKEDKILEYLLQRVKISSKKTFITTPNPEMLVYASKHLAYKDKLNHADIALPDGMGLFFASGLSGKQLEERITGVDFIEELCKISREKPLSIGFLGGRKGVAERAASCLKKKYPWINVIFTGSVWPDRKSIKDKVSNIKGENKKYFNTPIDILFVAFGVPRQEEWIYENLERLPVKAAMGVGGAFDFLSGAVPRAPFIVRHIGLEWLFRLIIQPWRWRRQLALLEFLLLVIKERVSVVR